MPTNAELAKIVEELQAKLEEQEDEIALLKDSHPTEPVFTPTEFKDAPDGGGWIVRTPNQKFNGNTNGIRFVQGMAVVAKSTEGERKVRSFIGEFKYSAVPINAEEMSSFNQHIASNLANLIDGKDKTMEEKLVGVTPLIM